MIAIKINKDCLIAPNQLGVTDNIPNVLGLCRVDLVIKWRGKNQVLLRPGEYKQTEVQELNSIDKLILSQIVANGRWLVEHGTLSNVELRAHILAQCEQNDIEPTSEEIDAAIAEKE